MISRGKFCGLIPALALCGGGCSSEEVGAPPGSGGNHSSSGTSGQAGGSRNGGTGGVIATGGALATGGNAGQGGSLATGGKAGAGQGGTLPTGGTASGAGGALATGGAASGAGGALATGGAPSGGSEASGGSGGTLSTGGAAGKGGKGGKGGAAGTAGMSGAGGVSGTGGASSTGGANAGGGGGLLPGNDPVSSVGCGTATTVTTGKKTITSSGQQRTYIIDIPANYDMNKPYRLFYTSHWIGSTSEAVRDQNYYFLKPLATAANEPAIFVAPQSDGSTWQEKDHALFDDILAYVKENLCIDTTRVFATGFSFGGMITYSLSVNHQRDIRAAVGIAPANYNIYVPAKTHEPIAWMQTTGMGDTTCPWVNGNSTTQGAKFIAIEHATDNGCTVPANIPTWQQGAHVCYDFEGCDPGFPTKACTFNGGHTNIASDSGNVNWIAEESWAFFTQF
jgi:poly(3-hydroxybutyrate) depolymerase